MSWHRAPIRIGRRGQEGGSTGTARGGTPRMRAARSLLVVLATAALACLPVLPQAALADDEKVETPTVSKEVWDGDEFAAAADAAAGEEVIYRITGTLPTNLDEFDFYAYEFHDQLPAALAVDTDSVAVLIVRDGEELEDVTALFEASLSEVDEGWELVVATDDLLQAQSALEAADTVVLTYTATLQADAAQAGEAAENYVYVRYTSKPFTDAFGRSTESSAALYTWALSVQKVSEDADEPLAGAAFAIRAQDGRYVQADGTLSQEEAALEVDADGALLIGSIDAGTYTVSEVLAPDGYEAIEDFTLVLSVDLDGTAPALSCSADSALAYVLADADAGTFTLVVADVAEETDVAAAAASALAKTGDALSRLWPAALALGALAGCAGACALHAHRRRAARRRDD